MSDSVRSCSRSAWLLPPVVDRTVMPIASATLATCRPEESSQNTFVTMNTTQATIATLMAEFLSFGRLIVRICKTKNAFPKSVALHPSDSAMMALVKGPTYPSHTNDAQSTPTQLESQRSPKTPLLESVHLLIDSSRQHHHAANCTFSCAYSIQACKRSHSDIWECLQGKFAYDCCTSHSIMYA